jgi:sigma-E factor negative regulatory protein RseC
MSNQTIDHLGIVETLTDNLATVKINSQSACAACHAKGACSAADQTEKYLSVNPAGQDIKIGETVRVLISKKTGLNAVAIGYIYPFLVLMVVLIACTIAGINELHAGLFALLSLAPYYLSVYLFREKISNAFKFKLEKLINDA